MITPDIIEALREYIATCADVYGWTEVSDSIWADILISYFHHDLCCSIRILFRSNGDIVYAKQFMGDKPGEIRSINLIDPESLDQLAGIFHP